MPSVNLLIVIWSTRSINERLIEFWFELIQCYLNFVNENMKTNIFYTIIQDMSPNIIEFGHKLGRILNAQNKGRILLTFPVVSQTSMLIQHTQISDKFLRNHENVTNVWLNNIIQLSQHMMCCENFQNIPKNYMQVHKNSWKMHDIK